MDGVVITKEGYTLEPADGGGDTGKDKKDPENTTEYIMDSKGFVIEKKHKEE